ncbi:MAG: aldehyde dehydrogenase family protein, partial [Planctomycetes bacterium]|nr:aldehyde dehydrogenase family protein [Planctomycetota bacterium]
MTSSSTTWDYVPAPESAPAEIAASYGLFINGDFRAAANGSTMASIEPGTGEELFQFAVAGPADVDAAVQAAQVAQPGWSSLPARDRGKYLFRIARRLQERAREFAVLETRDGGKPIKESRDIDIPEAAKHFFYYAGWADKLDYAFPGRRAQPVGVCAQIIPWNFPLLMAAWKLAPALACGNTVVLKPAETTPLTALRLAEVFQEVGLPDGVVNIVTGAGETGAALAGHPGVQKLAFTGSTEVGKKLAAQVAGTGKRLTLELGGKSPHIICDDASLDQ